MRNLENLLQDNERIADLVVCGMYTPYNFIVPADVDISRIDILGCIEDTLYRMINAEFTETEILSILGAEQFDEEYDNIDECTFIDLNYVIIGELLAVH